MTCSYVPNLHRRRGLEEQLKIQHHAQLTAKQTLRLRALDQLRSTNSTMEEQLDDIAVEREILLVGFSDAKREKLLRQLDEEVEKRRKEDDWIRNPHDRRRLEMAIEKKRNKQKMKGHFLGAGNESRMNPLCDRTAEALLSGVPSPRGGNEEGEVPVTPRSGRRNKNVNGDLRNESLATPRLPRLHTPRAVFTRHPQEGVFL